MYCSWCGKRILESMRYCPFCGAEVVIPEQDAQAAEPAAAAPAAQATAEALQAADGGIDAAMPAETDADATDEAEDAAVGAAVEIEDATDSAAVEIEDAVSSAAIEIEDLADSAADNLGDRPEPEAEPQETLWDIGGTPEARDDEETPEAPLPDLGWEPEPSGLDEAQAVKPADEPATADTVKITAFPEPDDSDWARPGAQSARQMVLKYWQEKEAQEQQDTIVRKEAAEGQESAAERRGRRDSNDFCVPVRPVQLDDLFMENKEDEEDDFDAFEEALERSSQNWEPVSGRGGRDDLDEDDLDDDDDDDESFFSRHLRGIIALMLVIALLGGLAFYAMTGPGQAQLAQINVTLPFIKAETYSRLGYERYQAGDYAKAGAYYERALAREPGNYNYASSAVMAYDAIKDTEKTTEMLKKCIRINPTAVEPYVYLLNCYPDPAQRPWEINQLIQQGYQTTGDQRLKTD